MMATQFDEIYTLNGAIAQDSRLSGKPDNIYYFILYQYLYFAMAEFSEYYYGDIFDTVPFEQTIDTYDSDGIETNFVLTSTPSIGSIFYVSIDNAVLDNTEYSYDSGTNSVTTTFGGTDIYIGTYIIGQFNETLNGRAKTILAEAMTFVFVENFVNDDKQLEQVMYSGVSFFSQSQHNKVNINVEQARRDVSFKNMIYYSYGRDMPSTVRLARKAGEVVV